MNKPANYTKSGSKSTATISLDKNVFDVDIKNHDILHKSYLAYLANGRDNYAQVKIRGLVSGGGRKPWKQKGTGRARFGSTRNPIWRGGGIVFGPTGLENYTKKVNISTKRKALRQALTLALTDNRLIVIDNFEIKDGKTAQAKSLLEKIGAKRKVLVVVDEDNQLARRAVSNIPDLKFVQANYINVFDLLNADSIVATNKALSVISEWLGETAKEQGGEK